MGCKIRAWYQDASFYLGILTIYGIVSDLNYTLTELSRKIFQYLIFHINQTLTNFVNLTNCFRTIFKFSRLFKKYKTTSSNWSTTDLLYSSHRKTASLYEPEKWLSLFEERLQFFSIHDLQLLVILKYLYFWFILSLQT